VRVDPKRNIAIFGTVDVGIIRLGKVRNVKLIKATGTSHGGSLNTAIHNMRLNAEFKYRSEIGTNYDDDNLVSKVRDYGYEYRDEGTSYKIFKRKNGKEYYMIHGSNGKILTWGRYDDNEVDDEELIYKTDTLRE
jgi:hypothetical protein